MVQFDLLKKTPNPAHSKKKKNQNNPIQKLSHKSQEKTSHRHCSEQEKDQ